LAAQSEGGITPTPGILARLGRFLDTPGRFVRSRLTGIPEATGRDVLQKFFGVRNKPGFDPSDVASFLTEVGLDPLTFVSGIGTLGRAGKLAQKATKIRATGRAARDLGNITDAVKEEAKLANLLKEIGPGGLTSLPKDTAGLRNLISVGLPFTKQRARLPILPRGIETGVIRGLGGIGSLPGIRQARSGLRKLFVPPGAGSPELRALLQRQAIEGPRRRLRKRFQENLKRPRVSVADWKISSRRVCVRARKPRGTASVLESLGSSRRRRFPRNSRSLRTRSGCALSRCARARGLKPWSQESSRAKARPARRPSPSVSSPSGSLGRG
jgi:hypothetical protein